LQQSVVRSGNIGESEERRVRTGERYEGSHLRTCFDRRPKVPHADSRAAAILRKSRVGDFGCQTQAVFTAPQLAKIHNVI